jgi:hypothetical protein
VLPPVVTYTPLVEVLIDTVPLAVTIESEVPLMEPPVMVGETSDPPVIVTPLPLTTTVLYG